MWFQYTSNGYFFVSLVQEIIAKYTTFKTKAVHKSFLLSQKVLHDQYSVITKFIIIEINKNLPAISSLIFAETNLKATNHWECFAAVNFKILPYYITKQIVGILVDIKSCEIATGSFSPESLFRKFKISQKRFWRITAK